MFCFVFIFIKKKISFFNFNILYLPCRTQQTLKKIKQQSSAYLKYKFCLISLVLKYVF